MKYSFPKEYTSTPSKLMDLIINDVGIIQIIKIVGTANININNFVSFNCGFGYSIENNKRKYSANVDPKNVSLAKGTFKGNNSEETYIVIKKNEKEYDAKEKIILESSFLRFNIGSVPIIAFKVAKIK